MIRGFTNLTPIKFWCQKVLPLVYDDSLSYYEVLSKVVTYLNKTREDLSYFISNWSTPEVVTDYNDFVNKDKVYLYMGNQNGYLNKYWYYFNPDTNSWVAGGEYGVYYDLPFVTPEMFGAIGDGETDDSKAFTQAIDYAHQLNVPLVCFEKTYLATDVMSEYICDIIGCGATVNFGAHAFLYDRPLNVSDIKIISTHAVDKNAVITAFLRTENVVDKVCLSNVEFVCSNASNTLRGYIFLRVLSKALEINDLSVSGCWSGVVVSNVLGLEPDHYNINEVIGRNVQTLIDFEGYVSSDDYSGFLSNAKVSNIELINTSAQKANYSAVAGSDCVLITNVKEVTLSNIKSTNAVERTIYAVNVTNMTIDNVTTVGTQSVKVVGTQLHVINPSLSGYIKSSGVQISNVFVRDAVDGYALLFYEADDVTVNGVYFMNASPALSDYGIGITGVCTRISVSHVRGIYASRGLIWLYATSGRDNDLTFIKFSDIRFDYPVNVSNYHAIRIEGIDSVFARYIEFDDVVFNEGYIKYTPNTNCSGLIRATYAQNLLLNNCDCKYMQVLGTGITIENTCSDVTVNGMIESSATPCVIDFRSSKGNYTVYQDLTRNNYTTRIENLGPYNSMPYFSSRFKQVSSMTLLSHQSQYLSNSIETGYIKIIGQNGWLEGYLTAGVFTPVHQAGGVNTEDSLVVFDAETMSLTLTSGSEYKVTVELYSNN